MTNTLPLTIDCIRCEGGFNEHTFTVPVDENRNPVIPDHITPEQIDRTKDGEVTKCRRCNGFGVRKKYDPYKTQANADKGRANRSAYDCWDCKGRGEVYELPGFTSCYTCSGVGKRPAWDPTRPVLPEECGTCDHATTEFMEGWIKSITITVIRAGRDLTWGESHLGIFGMGTCTDYGRRWERDPEDDWMLAMEIGEELMKGGEQFIKMMDKETRTFGPALVVILTRQGYTKVVEGAPLATGLGSLPPTYFPRVLEAM